MNYVRKVISRQKENRDLTKNHHEELQERFLEKVKTKSLSNKSTNRTTKEMREIDKSGEKAKIKKLEKLLQSKEKESKKYKEKAAETDKELKKQKNKNYQLLETIQEKKKLIASREGTIIEYEKNLAEKENALEEKEKSHQEILASISAQRIHNLHRELRRTKATLENVRNRSNKLEKEMQWQKEGKENSFFRIKEELKKEQKKNNELRTYISKIETDLHILQNRKEYRQRRNLKSKGRNERDTFIKSKHTELLGYAKVDGEEYFFVDILGKKEYPLDVGECSITNELPVKVSLENNEAKLIKVFHQYQMKRSRKVIRKNQKHKSYKNNLDDIKFESYKVTIVGSKNMNKIKCVLEECNLNVIIHDPFEESHQRLLGKISSSDAVFLIKNAVPHAASTSKVLNIGDKVQMVHDCKPELIIGRLVYMREQGYFSK